MSDKTDGEEIVARADTLEKRVAHSDMEAGFAELRLLGKRNRQLIHRLAIGGAALAVLSVVVAVGSYNLSHTVDRVEENSKSLKVQCQVANASNEKQLLLWDYALNLPVSEPSSPEDAAQQAEVRRKFEQYLHALFVPRDCDNLTATTVEVTVTRPKGTRP